MLLVDELTQRGCRVEFVERPMSDDPVWLKYCVTSRGLSMRVAEQSTEALPPHHMPCLTTHALLPCDQLVVEPLMIALVMIMGEVLLDRIIQGAFPEHDHLREGLLLDGAHEPFAVGVEIRTPRGQDDRFSTTRLEQRIKRLR